MTEYPTPYLLPAPGPRLPRLALVDDLDAEGAFAYPTCPEGGPLSPSQVATRLLRLAALADLAQGHPELVPPAGVLRHLREMLRDVAGRAVAT